MRGLLNCCYELMELELRAYRYENLFTLLHMAERIDLLCSGGIMEERNDGHTATQGEDRPVDSYEGTELDPLPDGSTEPVDKSGRGDIIETRENNGEHYKQDPDTGKMEGSEPYAEDEGGEGNVKADDRFDIHPDKINKFLLKPGAKHSQEFFDVGYKRDDYERLFDDIAKGYDKKKAVDFQADDKHRKDSFSIFMNLGVSSQKRFRTVWEQSREEGSKPRLITAHREE